MNASKQEAAAFRSNWDDLRASHKLEFHLFGSGSDDLKPTETAVGNLKVVQTEINLSSCLRNNMGRYRYSMIQADNDENKSASSAVLVRSLLTSLLPVFKETELERETDAVLSELEIHAKDEYGFSSFSRSSSKERKPQSSFYLNPWQSLNPIDDTVKGKASKRLKSHLVKSLFTNDRILFEECDCQQTGHAQSLALVQRVHALFEEHLKIDILGKLTAAFAKDVVFMFRDIEELETSSSSGMDATTDYHTPPKEKGHELILHQYAFNGRVISFPREFDYEVASVHIKQSLMALERKLYKLHTIQRARLNRPRS